VRRGYKITNSSRKGCISYGIYIWSLRYVTCRDSQYRYGLDTETISRTPPPDPPLTMWGIRGNISDIFKSFNAK